MVRLNTTAAGPLAPRVAANQSIFGAATCFTGADATHDATLVTDLTTCDPTGFPNGRRPGDDVVDIELRVAMGALLNTTDAPIGQLPLGDGATAGPLGAANAQAIGGSMAVNFDSTFPYLKAPIGGAP
jgi:hypothetical protein